MSVTALEVSPKRAAILAAASRLFMGEGFAAVSMDAVAREAGVSKATLYAHFTGKEALFGAIVEARCEAIAAEAEALAVHAPSPEGALRKLALLWMGFLLQPSTMAIHRVVIAEGGRFPEIVRRFYAAGPARGRALLTGWIAAEQRHGHLRTDVDPDEAAGHFGALLRGDLYFRTFLGGPVPDEAAIAAAAEAAVAVFLRAFGPTSAAEANPGP
ncbi:TetR/AcrR family transcriptional regulator [Muricoccus radiodurans]|uniref:TetR/AcrR family transcriptional regulator n=1 Tax=Muricoccus radiodurans TaxID=2231721 RepID=UPI003CF80D53